MSSLQIPKSMDAQVPYIKWLVSADNLHNPHIYMTRIYI